MVYEIVFSEILHILFFKEALHFKKKIYIVTCVLYFIFMPLTLRVLIAAFPHVYVNILYLHLHMFSFYDQGRVPLILSQGALQVLIVIPVIPIITEQRMEEYKNWRTGAVFYLATSRVLSSSSSGRPQVISIACYIWLKKCRMISFLWTRNLAAIQKKFL